MRAPPPGTQPVGEPERRGEGVAGRREHLGLDLLGEVRIAGGELRQSRLQHAQHLVAPSLRQEPEEQRAQGLRAADGVVEEGERLPEMAIGGAVAEALLRQPQVPEQSGPHGRRPRLRQAPPQPCRGGGRVPVRQRLARPVRQRLDGPVLADRVGLGQVAGDYGGAGARPPAAGTRRGRAAPRAPRRAWRPAPPARTSACTKAKGRPLPRRPAPASSSAAATAASSRVRRASRRGAGDLRIGIEDGGGPGQGLCRRREPVQPVQHRRLDGGRGTARHRGGAGPVPRCQPGEQLLDQERVAARDAGGRRPPRTGRRRRRSAPCTSTATAPSLRAGRRITVVAGSTARAARRGSAVVERAVSRSRTGRPSRRCARYSQKRSDAESAHWASSTASSNGRRAARLAVSQ